MLQLVVMVGGYWWYKWWYLFRAAPDYSAPGNHWALESEEGPWLCMSLKWVLRICCVFLMYTKTLWNYLQGIYIRNKYHFYPKASLVLAIVRVSIWSMVMVVIACTWWSMAIVDMVVKGDGSSHWQWWSKEMGAVGGVYVSCLWRPLCFGCLSYKLHCTAVNCTGVHWCAHS